MTETDTHQFSATSTSTHHEYTSFTNALQVIH